MQIKKIGAFILSLLMILSLAACGNNSAGTNSDQKESVDTRVEDTTVKEESDPSGQDTRTR